MWPMRSLKNISREQLHENHLVRSLRSAKPSGELFALAALRYLQHDGLVDMGHSHPVLDEVFEFGGVGDQ